MDAYKVLGLTEGATEEEIKTAYRALAQKYNPDNYEAGPLREEAEAKKTELNEAFDALMGAIRHARKQQARCKRRRAGAGHRRGGQRTLPSHPPDDQQRRGGAGPCGIERDPGRCQRRGMELPCGQRILL